MKQEEAVQCQSTCDGYFATYLATSIILSATNSWYCIAPSYLADKIDFTATSFIYWLAMQIFNIECK